MSEHAVEITLGERLRAARLSASLTQLAVAKAVGITVPAVSAFERDQRIPSLRMASKLTAVLRMSLEDMRLAD